MIVTGRAVKFIVMTPNLDRRVFADTPEELEQYFEGYNVICAIVDFGYHNQQSVPAGESRYIQNGEIHRMPSTLTHDVLKSVDDAWERNR